jgi:hypothetical protein
MSLFAALVFCWSMPEVRSGLLIAPVSHAVMRLWPAFDFIPKALAFERETHGELTAATARTWVRRSRLRLPLLLHARCFRNMYGAIKASVNISWCKRPLTRG